MKTNRIVALAAILAVGGLALSGCTSSSTDHRQTQLQENQKKSDSRTPPKVSGDTEYNNYIKAQEMYDDPSNILWCTGAFPSATSPIFTVPIAGKLTSSTVSYFPSEGLQNYIVPSTDGRDDKDNPTYKTEMGENQSVDGMYHGTAVPYRYGFTPGGQYVDFTGLAVFCTTALTEFQRQSLQVSTDADNGITAKAESELKAGNKDAAQDTVDGASK